MKTAHQFARELLAGPDFPVCVANHAPTGMHNLLSEPSVHEFTGNDSPDGGEAIDALEIYGDKPAMG